MVEDAEDKGVRRGGRASTSRGEAQRRTLVHEAYMLIAEGGFESLRTREVAARVGVNVATLHYYFPTKEDLVRGVAERLLRELMTLRDPSGGAEDGTPLGELRAEFADMRYQLLESPETHIVWFELYLRSLRDLAIRSILDDLDVSWRRHVESYLADGVRQGVFRHDLDVPAAASGLMAVIMGSILQGMTNPKSSPSDRTEAEIVRWITGASRYPRQARPPTS